ncbi:MAG TPA: RHS repeat-associated core domain-containing protein [Anaerolineae bacterium]|nr:RHS repeat-associated core domain-containing protein [Anaerolineae bacterium]
MRYQKYSVIILLLLLTIFTQITSPAVEAAPQTQPTATTNQPALATSATITTNSLKAGDTTPLTINYTNQADITLHDLQLQLPYNQHLTYHYNGITGPQPTIDLGNLAPKASLSLTIQVELRGHSTQRALSLPLTFTAAEIPPHTEQTWLTLAATLQSETVALAEGKQTSFNNGRLTATTTDLDALTYTPHEQYQLDAAQSGLITRFTLSHEKTTSLKNPLGLTLNIADLAPHATQQDIRLHGPDGQTIPFTLSPNGEISFTTNKIGEFNLVTGDPQPWSYTFNPPGASAFTGAANYNHSLDLPPGRNGLAPTINVNYGSRGVDNLRAPVMSQGFGSGWSMPQAQIINGYASHMFAPSCQQTGNCKDFNNHHFTLQLNGQSYKLIPQAGRHGRYTALSGPDLYIELINDTTSPNVTGEYWLVATSDGNQYRFGYTTDSEQVVTPVDLPGTRNNSQPRNNDFVAYTWKIDSMRNVYGNKILYNYRTQCSQDFITHQCRSFTLDNGQTHTSEADTAIDTITYNHVVTGTNETKISFGYRLRNFDFVRQETYMAANVFQPSRIHVEHNNQTISGYQFTYQEGDHKTHNANNDYTDFWMLTSITSYGNDYVPGPNENDPPTNGTPMPATTFNYDKNSLACDTEGSCVPFLTQINNGFGAVSKIGYQRYENDGTLNANGRWFVVARIFTWDGVEFVYGKHPIVTLNNVAQSHITYHRSSPNGTPATACFETYQSNCTPPTTPQWEESNVLVGFDRATVDVTDHNNNLIQRDEHLFNISNYYLNGKTIRHTVWDPNNPVTVRLKDTLESWTAVNDFARLDQIHNIVYDPTNNNNTQETALVFQYDPALQGGQQWGQITKEEKFHLIGNQWHRYQWQWFEYASRTDLRFDSATNQILGAWLLRPTVEMTFANDPDKLHNTKIYLYDNNTDPDTQTLTLGQLRWEGQVELPTELPTVGTTDNFKVYFVEHRYYTSGVRLGLPFQTRHFNNLGNINFRRDLQAEDYHWSMANLATSLRSSELTYFDTEGLRHTTITRMGYGTQAPPSQITSYQYANPYFWQPTKVINPNGYAIQYRYDTFGRLEKVIKDEDTIADPTILYQYRHPQPLTIINGDFEIGLNDWTEYDTQNSLTASSSTTAPQHGNALARIDISSTNGDYWYGTHAIDNAIEGQTYTVSAYIKSNAPSTGGQVCMKFNGQPGQEQTLGCVTTTTSWQRINTTVTVPVTPDSNNQADNFLIFFRFHNTGTYYLDNLTVSQPLERGIYTKQGNGQTIWQRDVFNGLGQNIQTQLEKDGNLAVVTNKQFNAVGQPIYISAPYEATSNPNGAYFLPFDTSRPGTHTSYDGLGRVQTVTTANGNTQTNQYIVKENMFITGATLGPQQFSLAGTIATDAKGQQTQNYYDPFGRHTLIREMSGNGTAGSPYAPYSDTYQQYDAYGNILSVTTATPSDTANGQVLRASQFTYDGFGRQLTQTDADMGTLTSAYDNSGNLIMRTDSNNQTLCKSYDVFDRILSESQSNNFGVCDSSATLLNSYTYDQNNIGSVTSITWGQGQDHFEYDTQGRVISQTRTIDNRDYTLTFLGYNRQDKPTQLRYPNGEILTIDYNQQGQAVSLNGWQTYASDAVYNAHGKMTSFTAGDSSLETTINHTFAYDQTGANNFRLQSISAVANGNTLSAFTNYTYDDNGNITGFNSNIDGVTETLIFPEYDHRDRLLSAQAVGGPASFMRTYQYDILGNIIQRTDNLNDVYDYEYDATQPDAVDGLTLNQNSHTDYTYDNNGNMTGRQEGNIYYDQQFDIFNRLSQIVVSTGTQTELTTFAYDNGENRVKTVNPDGSITYNPFLFYEETVTDQNNVANLTIDNAGFENGSWTTSGTNSATAITTNGTSATSHTGQSALSLSNMANATITSPYINVRPGTHTFSTQVWASIRNQLNNNAAYLQVEFLAEKGTNPSPAIIWQSGSEFTTTGYDSISQQFTVPNGVSLLRFSFHIQDANGIIYLADSMSLINGSGESVILPTFNSNNWTATTHPDFPATGLKLTTANGYSITNYGASRLTSPTIDTPNSRFSQHEVSLKIKSTFTDLAIACNVLVVAEYFDSLNNSLGQLTVWNSNAAGNSCHNSNWITIQNNITPLANATSMKLHISQSGNGALNIDNVTVKCIGTFCGSGCEKLCLDQAASAEQILYSNYFYTSQNLNSWQINTNSTNGSFNAPASQLYFDADGGYTGGGVTFNNMTQGQLISNYIATDGNFNHTLTGWVRGQLTSNANLGAAQVKLAFYDQNQQFITDSLIWDSTQGLPINNSWAQFTNSIVSPANTAFARIFIVADQINGWHAFDDFALTSTPLSENVVTRVTYALNGKSVAQRETTTSNGQTTNRVDYLLTDHLGTVVAMSNDGDIVTGTTARYFPFGQFRTEPTADLTNHGYTGHRHNNLADNDLGLIYMNARYYLPEIGRFISADSIVPKFENPQTHNRYSYVFNNPVFYNDPSGHCPWCFIGAVVGGAITGVTYAITTDDFQLDEFAVATTAGAVGGALIGTGVGAPQGVAMVAGAAGISTVTAGGIITGAGAGVLVASTSYLATTDDYQHNEMVINAVAGGIEGGIMGGLAPISAGSGIVGAGQAVNVASKAVNVGAQVFNRGALSGTIGAIKSMVTDVSNGHAINFTQAQEEMVTGLISTALGEVTPTPAVMRYLDNKFSARTNAIIATGEEDFVKELVKAAISFGTGYAGAKASTALMQ